MVTIVATDELARNIYSGSEYSDYKANNHGDVLKRAAEKTAGDLYSDALKDQLGYDAKAVQQRNRALWNQVSGAAASVATAAGDAWDYLTEPDDALAPTNSNALSQAQSASMASNAYVQNQVNRDDALINGNFSNYYDLDPAAAQMMSTDVDPYALQN